MLEKLQSLISMLVSDSCWPISARQYFQIQTVVDDRQTSLACGQGRFSIVKKDLLNGRSFCFLLRFDETVRWQASPFQAAAFTFKRQACPACVNRTDSCCGRLLPLMRWVVQVQPR